MHVLAFAGSLRQDSLNKRLARHVVARLERAAAAVPPNPAGGPNVTCAFLDLKPYALPVYDGDVETAGLPAGVAALAAEVAKATALVVAAPEYNGSIAGPLKNALDWLSRVRPTPLAGKHVFLLSASPGALGGVRGLWHTRVPFEALGCHVFPTMTGVPRAHEAFGADGALLDASLSKQIDETLASFLGLVARAAV